MPGHAETAWLGPPPMRRAAADKVGLENSRRDPSASLRSERLATGGSFRGAEKGTPFPRQKAGPVPLLLCEVAKCYFATKHEPKGFAGPVCAPGRSRTRLGCGPRTFRAPRPAPFFYSPLFTLRSRACGEACPPVAGRAAQSLPVLLPAPTAREETHAAQRQQRHRRRLGRCDTCCKSPVILPKLPTNIDTTAIAAE